jgi:hypothetical protein
MIWINRRSSMWAYFLVELTRYDSGRQCPLNFYRRQRQCLKRSGSWQSPGSTVTPFGAQWFRMSIRPRPNQL